MRMFRTAFSLSLGICALFAGNASAAETHILASIKPLELIVRAVATDDMATSTLVPPGASPHNYSMAPSQRRALENADVIFWVGPDMETFLNRLLTGGEFSGRSVALMGEDENAQNPAAEDHSDHGHHDHDHEDHGHENEHNHGHSHEHGADPHIWVDPQLAITMAETIRDSLAGLEGADQQALTRNLEAFRAAVEQKEQDIRAQLQPLQNASLFAYHSAFERFAEHYDLKLEGVLTLNPELSPGARHIAEVQSQLREAHRPCLLTEPQFNRQWWRSITEGLDVTFSTWDPLAIDIEATANGYVMFQQSIADAVLKCLPEQAEH